MAACRICLDSEGELASPCACRGSTAWVHVECLIEWCRRTKDYSKCSLCHEEFVGKASVLLAEADLQHATEAGEKLLKSHNLAKALQMEGRIDESIALHKKNLRTCESLKGNRNSGYVAILSSLARALAQNGHVDEALAMQARSFETTRSIRGQDHVDSLTIANNYALALGDYGRYEDAVRILRETVAGRTRVLGRNHKDTLMATVNLAGTLCKSGQYDGVVELLDTSLSAIRQTFGNEHQYYLDVARNLVAALCHTGRIGDAIVHQRHIWIAEKERRGEADNVTLEAERQLETLKKAMQSSGHVARDALATQGRVPAKRSCEEPASPSSCKSRRSEKHQNDIDMVLSIFLGVGVPYEEALIIARRLVTEGFDSILALQTLTSADLERMGVKSDLHQRRLLTFLADS